MRRTGAASRSASTTCRPSSRSWTTSSRRRAGGGSRPTSPSAASITRWSTWRRSGWRSRPRNARALAEAGIELKALLAEQVSVQHPELPGVNEIAYVMFRSQEPDGAVRTCTTLKPGRVDRSPCGTGSSANLAVLHARGLAKVGDQPPLALDHRRRVRGGADRRDTRSATSRRSCRASPARRRSTAPRNLNWDPADPFFKGFALSDTWGPQVDRARIAARSGCDTLQSKSITARSMAARILFEAVGTSVG